MTSGWISKFCSKILKIVFFGIDNSFLALISKVVNNYLIFCLYPFCLYLLNTLFFLRDKVFILVFFHSGSRGLTVLTSLGTKLDIIFNMVSFKISIWRLGLMGYASIRTHRESYPRGGGGVPPPLDKSATESGIDFILGWVITLHGRS